MNGTTIDVRYINLLVRSYDSLLAIYDTKIKNDLFTSKDIHMPAQPISKELRLMSTAKARRSLSLDFALCFVLQQY